MLKLKKGCYYENLNRDIEESNQIKWSNLKKLKDAKRDPDQLDLLDHSNFYQFLKRLYSKAPDNIQMPPKDQAWCTYLLTKEKAHKLLNEDMTIDELNHAISKLKPGKALGKDCIPNEFLRSSNIGIKLMNLHVFNQCLAIRIYP